MELGEKLRHARQEAGLSQRRLCGEYMTRNMLSLIENGTAKPSMDTLRYLAGQLGKPVSFFLEEDAVLSPNQTLMAEARQKWAQGQVQEVWLLLKNFRQPDPVLEWQWRYLSALADMEAAKLAARTGRERYALQLLEEAARWEIPELERQRLIQLGRLAGEELPRIVQQLPSMDEELLLRAEAALMENRYDRASALLEAAEDQMASRWNLLRGQCLYAQKRYAGAAMHLQRAEEAYPAVLPLLEACFRETGDYKRAYEYACKQR